MRTGFLQREAATRCDGLSHATIRCKQKIAAYHNDASSNPCGKTESECRLVSPQAGQKRCVERKLLQQRRYCFTEASLLQRRREFLTEKILPSGFSYSAGTLAESLELVKRGSMTLNCCSSVQIRLVVLLHHLQSRENKNTTT